MIMNGVPASRHFPGRSAFDPFKYLSLDRKSRVPVIRAHEFGINYRRADNAQTGNSFEIDVDNAPAAMTKIVGWDPIPLDIDCRLVRLAGTYKRGF